MLTAKQKRFVDEYTVDLSGAKAAIRAGFSAKTAREIAHGLLKKPEVCHAVNEAIKARSQRVQLQADQVVRELYDLAFADATDVVEFVRTCCSACYPDEKVDRRDPNPACEACFGDGIGTVEIKDTRTLIGGAKRLFDGVKQTREGLEVKVRDRTKALELLGRHLGMFNDKLELTKPQVRVRDFTGRKRTIKVGEFK